MNILNVASSIFSNFTVPSGFFATSFTAAPISRLVKERLMLSIAASALSGVPSWNVIPSRIVIVNSVESSFASTLSARYGLTSRLSSTTTSGS